MARTPFPSGNKPVTFPSPPLCARAAVFSILFPAIPFLVCRLLHHFNIVRFFSPPWLLCPPSPRIIAHNAHPLKAPPPGGFRYLLSSFFFLPLQSPEPVSCAKPRSFTIRPVTGLRFRLQPSECFFLFLAKRSERLSFYFSAGRFTSLSPFISF